MKKILVALDGSGIAARVIEQAVALARAMGARLVLFRAVSLPLELPMEALTGTQDQLMATLMRHAQRDLESLAMRIPADVSRVTRTALGCRGRPSATWRPPRKPI